MLKARLVAQKKGTCCRSGSVHSLWLELVVKEFWETHPSQTCGRLGAFLFRTCENSEPRFSAHSIPSISNPKQVSLAPLLEVPATGHPIEDSYIVALKDDISPAAFGAHTVNFIQNELQRAPVDDGLQEIGHRLKHIYNSHVPKGYADTFAPSTINKIRARPGVRVNYIEVDRIVHVTLPSRGVRLGSRFFV